MVSQRAGFAALAVLLLAASAAAGPNAGANADGNVTAQAYTAGGPVTYINPISDSLQEMYRSVPFGAVLNDCIAACRCVARWMDGWMAVWSAHAEALH